jgi:hypothetical protein
MHRRLEVHNPREFCKRIASIAALSGGFATVFSACNGNPTGSIPASAIRQFPTQFANNILTIT